jgi:WD40 repeat protein
VDLKTMQLKWLVTAHRAYICSARFSPDDKTLAIANWDGTASLWNVASGQEMFSYRASGVVWNAIFSQDGKWLSVGSGSDQHSEMALFRSATPAEVQAADLPAIYVQPVSQISTAGRSVTFGVSAVGEGASPLSYQWRKGADNLSRQTNATLTLANVTAADAGDYSVVVTNLLGSATSSNAMLKLLNVREETIAEVNFQDKQPAWSSAFTYCENPVPLTTNIMEVAGAGVGGTTGLVMTADGSGFTNNMSQNYSGFAATVGAYGGKTNGIDTTDLGLYKLYATIRTAGLTGKSANGSVQWDFVTVPTKDAVHTVLALYAPVTFTTNYQVYSFVLSDGLISDFPGGSFSEFKREFDQINGLQLEVQANEWVNKYDMGVTNALYISNVKFVRLVPVTPSPPGGVTK